MKKTWIACGCFLWCAAAGLGQTKASAKTASLPKLDAGSNEEMNIRAYIELLRVDTRKAKAQIVGEVMALDADDAAKFWPIYKDFEAEYAGIGDKIIGLVKSYAEHYTEMTDAAADTLANQVLDIEQQRNALKKKYYGQFKQAVGVITATRFLQVENQLERLLDLQIAAQLPIIGEQ